MAINGVRNVKLGAGTQVATKVSVNNNQSDSIFGFRSTPEELDKYLKENGLFADSTVKKQEKAKPAPKKPAPKKTETKNQTKKQQQTQNTTNTQKKTSSTKSSNNPFVTTSAQLDAHIKGGLFGNGPLEKPQNVKQAAAPATAPATKKASAPVAKKPVAKPQNTANNGSTTTPNKKLMSRKGAVPVTKNQNTTTNASTAAPVNATANTEVVKAKVEEAKKDFAAKTAERKNAEQALEKAAGKFFVDKDEISKLIQALNSAKSAETAAEIRWKNAQAELNKYAG